MSCLSLVPLPISFLCMITYNGRKYLCKLISNGHLFQITMKQESKSFKKKNLSFLTTFSKAIDIATFNQVALYSNSYFVYNSFDVSKYLNNNNHHIYKYQVLYFKF